MSIDEAGRRGGEDVIDVDLAPRDGAGRARMVDVAAAPWTHRRAVARGRVLLGAPTAATLHTSGAGALPGRIGTWGELFDAARVAGIQAAKQTSALVPLCQSLPSSAVTVGLFPSDGTVSIESRADVVGPTGVEMEALVACTVAGLTLMGALLPFDPDVSMDDVALWETSGGRSGRWLRR